MNDVGEIGIRQKFGHEVRMGFEEVVDFKRRNIMGLNFNGTFHVILPSES